ncbi:hypothetical protein C8R44DRAFT_754227 [Mycena epipterygia]|nr:hypothetical protein C8R44DRAFT_754227 [Mycena epipterygia]
MHTYFDLTLLRSRCVRFGGGNGACCMKTCGRTHAGKAVGELVGVHFPRSVILTHALQVSRWWTRKVGPEASDGSGNSGVSCVIFAPVPASARSRGHASLSTSRFKIISTRGTGNTKILIVAPLQPAHHHIFESYPPQCQDGITLGMQMDWNDLHPSLEPLYDSMLSVLARIEPLTACKAAGCVRDIELTMGARARATLNLQSLFPLFCAQLGKSISRSQVICTERGRMYMRGGTDDILINLLFGVWTLRRMKTKIQSDLVARVTSPPFKDEG